jgi:hypothetical protein
MIKQQRAIELRDIALALVQARGTLQSESCKSTSTVHRVLIFDSDGFKILYRTPFQRLPGATISYGLDVWRNGKVLSIEWTEDDDGRVDVICYKAGPWEAELAALGTAAGIATG